MIVRLLAVALAFAITGAPVAMTMCEAACATRSATAMQGGDDEHHSCHEGASSSEPHVAAVPHGCAHADGSELRADIAAKIFAPPIVLARCVTFVAPMLEVSTSIGVRTLGHSPPGSLTLSTQLRL